MDIRIELASHATSYGQGPFHPAIQAYKTVHYWPNVTFHTEDEAYAFAAKALKDAYDAAAAVAQEWNIFPV